MTTPVIGQVKDIETQKTYANQTHQRFAISQAHSGSRPHKAQSGTVGHSRARWLSRMFTVSLSTKTIKDTKDKVLMQMSKFSRQASTSLELSESDRAEGSLH